MCGAILPLSPYAFIAWCSVEVISYFLKIHRTIYFTSCISLFQTKVSVSVEKNTQWEAS
jgi:hypothetical protein